MKELIEQIGRDRLEFLSKAENLPELQKLAQFALAVLDAKPVIYEAEINGFMSSVTKSHYDDCKRFGVPVRELYAAPPATIVPVCEWTYDESDYFWSSSCGEDWQFTDGGPEDNRVKFCQGCGGLVKIAAAPEPGQ